MSEKRFEVVLNEFDEVEYIMDKEMMEDMDFADFMIFVEELAKENEQLRQLLEEYRKTNKHLSELCADASKNGYLPPLEDIDD